MDEKSTRHVFDDYAEELRTKIRFVTLRFLGIEELKIVGAYRAMITNFERTYSPTTTDARTKRLCCGEITRAMERSVTVS